LFGTASRADAAWPAPGDVLVLTSAFDGTKFHGHVFAVDPVTLVKTRVVDFDTFFEPEIYLASRDLHILPNGIAAAPDGSIWAFYSNGVLLRIKANGTHQLFPLALAGQLGGIAFAADGKVIVVTNNNNLAGLFRFDPVTGAVATFVLNNSVVDPDCNPNTSVCLPVHFVQGYGLAVDPVTGYIMVGDVEGGVTATPTGTFCQQLADCGAVYVVVPGAEFLVTDPTSPYFGKTVVSGTKTLLTDFGDPADGPLGDDAGLRVTLANDGTLLVTDPALQIPGGKSGALFRVQTNGTHAVVTRFDDVTKGQPGGVDIAGPFPVAITGDGTVLINGCDGVASILGTGLAICAVDATGFRRLWSDFGVTISIDGVDRKLFGARALAIQASIQPPIAKATAPTTVAAGAGCLASVTLDGSASIDPNGGALTYEWSEGGIVIATGVSPTVSLGIGPHTITLKVSNPTGGNDSIAVTVTVTTDVTLTYLGPSLLQAPGGSLVQTRASTAAGALVGAAVTFTINGVPYPATTDGAGVASAVVGVVAGASAIVQVTTTGGACQSAMTTVTVPVNRWPAASGRASAPNVADASCTAAVTLDASTSFDLDGDPLTYRWSEAATTLSTLKTPTVTLGVGTHQITLTVDDGRGGSSSNIISAEVLGQAVTLNYEGPAQLAVGVSAPVSARVRTAGGVPVAGAIIGFSINGFGMSAKTDAAGVAVAYVTPSIVGATTLLVSYAGDGCVQSAQTSAPVTVSARPATLVVVTSVINDDGGNAVSSAFAMTVNGVDPIPASFPGNAAGTTVSINVGPYSVNESNLPGYDTTFSADCTGTIALGETRTCTIVNNDRPTTLQLTASVLNGNGGTALPSAWTLTANGTSFTSGVAQQVAPGNYVLAESGGPSGYTASSWSCSGGTLAGNVVTVATNTAVQCFIVNDDQPASLTLTKIVVNDNGGTATAANWRLTANLLPFVSGVAQSVNAGVYALAESGGPGGYVAGPWACVGGALAGGTLTLQLGQTASCSITDDDQGATLTVIERVINDDGGTRQSADFIITVTGTSAVPASFPGSAAGTLVTLNAGAYSVGESGPAGYAASMAGDCVGTMGLGEVKTCTITNNDLPANTPPVADDQTVTTREDVSGPIVLTATDAENDPLTFTIVTGPANGSLSGAAPNITYTPKPGYYGSDSFTFRTNDGKADSNVATVRLTVTPVRADVTIAIVDAPDPVVVGQPLTYTIRVANLGPAVVPATVVTITLPAGVVLSAAPATCTGAGPLICPQGTLAVADERTFVVQVVPQNAGVISAAAVATSSAPDPLPGNNSATADTIVDRSPTSVALASSPNTSTAGTPVTFTAIVTGAAPTGTVSFYDGPMLLGSSALVGGSASLIVSLGVGSHTITAVYNGDPNHAPSTAAPLTQIVNNPNGKTTTVTTLVSSVNPSLVGQPVTFTATVTGANPAGTVTFMDVNGVLGTAPLINGVATITVPGFNRGAHQITASYGGDGNNLPSTSGKVKQQVR
jgi:uncharacterized repeat protein (TIGR01451 family)